MSITFFFLAVAALAVIIFSAICCSVTADIGFVPFQCPSSQSDDSLHTTFGLCSCSQSSYHLWLVFMQSVFIIIFGLCSFSHFSNHLSLAFIVILQTTFGLCSQTFSIPLFACVHSHSAYHFTLCSLSFFIPALACVHSQSPYHLWLVFMQSFSYVFQTHLSKEQPFGTTTWGWVTKNKIQFGVFFLYN